MADKEDKASPADIETVASLRVISAALGDVKSLVSSDYDEYLQLEQTFQGEKLKKLTRKIDFRVLPQLILLYLLCYIDRSNAGNVKLFGALEDLKLSGQDWNTAMCVFSVSARTAGYRPSSPCGVLNLLHGVTNNVGGFVSLRLLLGFAEAGVYPGSSYVLTIWYAPAQVHERMTTFYSAASLATAFSGLLAYGIGHLDHTWGYRGWRFIYVIEGLFSTCVGLLYFFVLSPSPDKVQGWLTEEERRSLVLRNRFARVGNTGVGEDEAFSWKHARQAFRSIRVYSVAIIRFTICVVVDGISFVLPTIISMLGYSALKAQALTAPPYVFACATVFFSGWAADRYQKRMLSQVIPNIVACVGFVIVIASVRYSSIPGVTYFGIFFMAGGLQCLSPATMAWVALNLAGDMKRSVGMAIMVSIAQLGGIVGSNIFLADEAPVYSTGFGICLGMLVVFGVVWPIIYGTILRRINAQRDRFSPEEIAARHTEEELADLGDRSPLFRYAT